MALALCVLVTPAQAWTPWVHGDGSVVSWWAAVVDALATIFPFGVDQPTTSTPQGDNSCMIDPLGGCHS
jgi:hypothetical protein